MGRTVNERELVLDMLLEMEREKEYSHRLVKAVLDKYDYLEPREKAFIKRLAEGTLERKIELDHYLDRFSSTPVRKMRPLIRCLLRMSVYQLLYMDAVPDSAVCDEACKLAGKRGFGKLRGYVNGVLRNISRNKEKLSLPEDLSLRYSMPEWLVELWTEEYGGEITAKLLEGLMGIHPVSLRFASKLSREERESLQDLIREQGVELTESPYLRGICLAEHVQGLHALPGFAEGKFLVQDASSALAVEAAEIREDDFVIDVCGAPGGKSLYAAEKAKRGRVLSRDVSGEKTALIEENAARMGADNLTVEVYDAVYTDENLRGKADVVLLDVPCSGLGVMGKKRDIKYHVTKEGMESLMELQRRIVGASAGYVKPGGALVYSTCTIHRGENEDMVRYISEELGFEPVSLEGLLPERVLAEKRLLEEDLSRSCRSAGFGLSEAERDACIQFLPGYMETDGFFLARFRRPGGEPKENTASGRVGSRKKYVIRPGEEPEKYGTRPDE